MNQITCVLDACSIINLIHIDENDFLLKKLKNIDFYLCEKVFKEVNINVFDKINKIRRNEELNSQVVKARKEEINKKLNQFRSNQMLDYVIKHDLGDDIFDEVRRLTGYTKYNGEFYSAVLALYLSRCKPLKHNSNDFIPTKLYFHTDDYPAKNEFDSFYRYQQIGYIEDTADLLILIYRLDDNFTLRQLDIALNDLFSEYATEVVLLKRKLRNYKKNLPKNLIRDKFFVNNLNLLIIKLENIDFNGIIDIKDGFVMNNSKYGTINKILKTYEPVFELDYTSLNLLNKIKSIREKLETIHKI